MFSTVIVLLIVAVLVYAYTRPSDFRIARTISINAAPETIFPLIADFHTWEHWSPYEKKDAEMKKTYSGAEKGEGAVYEWEGKKVGSGRMEIVETVEPSKITIKLDFIKPMKAHNTTEYTLEKNGDATTVTWAMSGSNAFMGKLMSVFISMEKLVGTDFEVGLANIKAIAEKK